MHRRKKFILSLPCGPRGAEKEILKLDFDDRIESLNGEVGCLWSLSRTWMYYHVAFAYRLQFTQVGKSP